MTRHVFTFLGTFVAGALIALVARAALFDPNIDHTGHTAGGGDYAPMVANTNTPTADAHTSHDAAPASARSDNHAAHTGSNPSEHTHADTAPSAASSVATVNTVCAICGMDVDPELPTAEYQGKTIGFGCKVCPAKFKANPDKYGPASLRNEVVKG